MHDIDDARELILAEWRSLHPLPSDNLGIDLPVFVEGVLAMPDSMFGFQCEGDRRQLIRDWVTGLENERHRDQQSQYDEIATL